MAGDERVRVAGGGQRLDQVLAALPSVGSRAKARQALASGKVSVDGVAVGADDGGRSLAEGTVVVIAWNRPGSSARRTAGREKLAAAGVTVLYEDEHLIAVDKPAGLLTDAASVAQVREEDTLTKRVRAWVGRGGEVAPVHRIDRDTTGVVLFAKTTRARDALKEQWGARTPLRQYLVVVEGVVRGDEGHFADWMVWDGRGKRQRPCPPGAEGGVLAEADWKVRERLNGATVLEVRLVSGRRNQIRLHAELWGHPLVGERLYRRTPARLKAPRQALHAERLGVWHPVDGRDLVFEAPLPADMAALIRRLRAPTPR